MITGGRLQSFLHWLETWFSQAKQTSVEEQPQRPPAPVTELIAKELLTLPSPDPFLEVVRSTADDAIRDWQTNREAANSLVLLSSPVEPIEEILRRSLTEWCPETDPAVTVAWPFGRDQRCRDILAMPALLHNHLDPDKSNTEEQNTSDLGTAEEITNSLDQRQTVVVIPALELYFLRCIQGWEGVEYLQNLITQDRRRFWIIGCNTWGWTFLDRVCRIGAYLERAETLPRLQGKHLQAWLRPVAQSILSPEEAEDPEDPEDLPIFGSESYWNALAGLASGISTTAAALWTRSYRLPTDRAEKLEDLDLTELDSLQGLLDQFPLRLDLVKPTLPGLMSLEALDRYLLHSLLIHRRMTRTHLAESLGETERLVRTRLQVLQREGVILQRGDEMRVNPVHYPKLRSELSNNNYLIGEI